MLLLIPGPVQTHPDTRAAMAVDIAPWDHDFRPVVAGIRERVRAVAGGVEGEHVALPLQGCGHFIVEAAVRTFVAPGGKVLVPTGGAYGDRAARLVAEAGRQVVPLPGPDTRPIDPADVTRALEADRELGHVLLVHHETGSGVVNEPEAIGAAVRAAGRRLLFDSVSAFGALPFSIANHPECDAVVFTSGKCLEGPPGIGFAVARIDRVLASAGNAGSWSFDLRDVYTHGLRTGPGSFRFTPPVQALNALSVALDLYEREGGQPARLARYEENARTLYDGVLALGLRPYLERRHQGPVIVTVHQPRHPAFALQRFVDELKARGVLISNFHCTEAPTFRIGCIGHVTPAEMRGAVAAIGGALEAMGVRERVAA